MKLSKKQLRSLTEVGNRNRLQRRIKRWKMQRAERKNPTKHLLVQWEQKPRKLSKKRRVKMRLLAELLRLPSKQELWEKSERHLFPGNPPPKSNGRNFRWT